MELVSLYNGLIRTSLYIRPTVEMINAGVRQTDAKDILEYLAITPENIRTLFIKDLERVLIGNFGDGKRVQLIMEEIKKKN
ncbi:MAG: hypothetical protein AABW91_02115 [Nanoarchaeota archaeon]